MLEEEMLLLCCLLDLTRAGGATDAEGGDNAAERVYLCEVFCALATCEGALPLDDDAHSVALCLAVDELCVLVLKRLDPLVQRAPFLKHRLGHPLQLGLEVGELRLPELDLCPQLHKLLVIDAPVPGLALPKRHDFAAPLLAVDGVENVSHLWYK